MQKILPYFIPQIYNKIIQPFNILRKKYKQQPFLTLYEAYTSGDLILFLDPPQIAKKTILPKNMKIVGPVECSFNIKIPEWIEKAKTGRPWVYISMGSSGDITLLPKIVDVLLCFNVEIIVSTAGKKCILPKKERLWVEEYLPQNEILKHCHLFINNGGTAAIYSALKRGIHIIGLPSNIDQFKSMSIFSELKLGVLLRPDFFSETKFHTAVKKSLAQEKGNEFYSIDAGENFAKIIAEVFDEVSEERSSYNKEKKAFAA